MAAVYPGLKQEDSGVYTIFARSDAALDILPLKNNRTHEVLKAADTGEQHISVKNRVAGGETFVLCRLNWIELH